MAVTDVLAEVITYLKTSTMRDNYWDADRLRECNDNLASQITMLEHRLATEPDPKSCPTKRKVEDCDWPSPSSKRFSASPSQDPLRLSTCQRVQPRPIPELQCPSMLGSTSQLQPLRRGDESCDFPLSCKEERLSPSMLPEASVPDVRFTTNPNLTPSPSYCDIVEPSVKDEDLAEVATVWTLYATAGSRLSLGQFDIWATEEDLVSLYL
ncbi:uncharacterized protein LOC133528589 [Cydia pomonella]|uniref:uncharacterized protein LOC133528589 n=1 Tax=Cydia pomonella TaxID=82600 RepID=UPI002ADE3254|nr:uncharacterized protein LOC133528589 [Cydia pomonella]